MFGDFPLVFYKEANAVRARLQVKNLVGKMLENAIE